MIREGKQVSGTAPLKYEVERSLTATFQNPRQKHSEVLLSCPFEHEAVRQGND